MRKTVIIMVFALIATSLFFGENLFAKKRELEGQWVNSYWFRPLPPQGKLPKGFSDIESSLMPEDCGTCHEEQYEAWKTARHSKSMGHGVVGQFHKPWMDEYGVLSCQNCHAPLYEQNPYIEAGDELVKNQFFQKDLRHQGVACAVCHVRKQVRYGPIPREMQTPETPHNGFTVIKDFNRAEFCKSCHQFPAGANRINGKLIENTYEEWKASPFAKKGIVCANCHMPDREHSFKGIHSQKMVNDGLTIKLDKGATRATLLITNSHVGHKFPTYVTPMVKITGRVVLVGGKAVKETLVEDFIQWRATLQLKEVFDTRLSPGETFKMDFDFPPEYTGNIYEIKITVYPDDFYNRFFKSLLGSTGLGIDKEEIKKAVEETDNSSFVLYKREIPF